MKYDRVLTGLGAALVAAGAYAARRMLIARLFNLPPPRNSVTVHDSLRLPMADGVTLATDLFLPDIPGPSPTILIRTPYGRPASSSGLMNRFIAQRFAERGYNVVAQDVRGRMGSEGEWEPYVHEASDGVATIDWITQQPWSNGDVGMWGQSYVGYVQWAAASTGTPHLKALVPSITQSFLAEQAQNSYQLDRALRWLLLLDAIENPTLSRRERLGRTINARVQDRILAPAFDHLPLGTVDEAILGQPVGFYRTWMEHPEHSDAYWQQVDFRSHVSTVTAPAHLIGGWYDIFLEGQLADYAALRAADHHPYLTIGPWTHLDRRGQWASIRLGLAWFDHHLQGRNGSTRGKPVRLYVMGADEWREFDAWPPTVNEQVLYLHEHGKLSQATPAATEQSDHYRYDPSNPTPNVGGALLSSEAGPRDNRELEARADVLTYTSEVLISAMEIIGSPKATLWVESSVAYTDFFARLTDVHPDGRSINICDAHVRLQPEPGSNQLGGVTKVTLSLSPTAYRFLPGHRIRLQVSSGAHPRVARNLGTGEPVATAARMMPAEQTLYHDETHPSHLVLPVSREKEQK